MSNRYSLKRLFILTLLLVTMLMSSCANDYSQLSDGLYVNMKTNKGDIIISLEFEKTPLTVINFVGLAEGTIDTDVKSGPFYDGLIFHRVIDDFMIQGGDPKGNGTGGPGYSFPDEFDSSLVFNGPGILAMANSGPATNGSQFFITHVATDWLQGKHTVFGHVVEGMDVVNKIAQGDTIKEVEVIRKGSAAENFKADQAAFNAMTAGQKETNQKKQEEAEKDILATISDRLPNAVVSDNGIRYVIFKEGTGNTPQKGDEVEVHYTGTFLDGSKFDSSRDRNETFKFPVGAGRVIPGWDATVLEMKKGEKRTIALPPEMAYGSRGAGGIIPPNAWLMFEIELIDY